MASYTDIANLWAAQEPKGPKKAGNFWRNGREAGHYRACIANIVDAQSGPIALVLDTHWGTGTAAFINQCAAAAKAAGLKVFKVPKRSNDVASHTANLEYFESKARECEAKIPRARSVDWQAAADSWRAEASRYRKAFAIKSKSNPTNSRSCKQGASQ